MRRTSLPLLLGLAVATLGLTVLAMLTSLRAWFMLAGTSWLEWVAIAALAIMILRLGWLVRAYLKGNRPNLDGIRAARTLALAKAGSLTGAVLLGRYSAMVVVGFLDWNSYWIVRSRHLIVIEGAIAAVLALALVVAGLLAEHWCEIPPSSSEPRAQKQQNATELTAIYHKETVNTLQPVGFIKVSNESGQIKAFLSPTPRTQTLRGTEA